MISEETRKWLRAANERALEAAHQSDQASQAAAKAATAALETKIYLSNLRDSILTEEEEAALNED